MDWRFLEEECKKSLRMYVDWIAFHKKKELDRTYIDRQDKLIIEWTDSKERFTVVDYRVRDLYDFFDEKEIKISIDWTNSGFKHEIATTTRVDVLKGLPHFTWHMQMPTDTTITNTYTYKDNQLFNSRGECEIYAFKSAFILLQNDAELLKKEWRNQQIKNIEKDGE
jgi:hypothetical protein